MNKKEAAFVQTVQAFYKQQGRHALPWRKTKDPYKILISEVMLQQTQVERVVPKYHEFLKRFPTIEALSLSSLSEVLTVWQGLGYNRRGKLLWECAKKIAHEYNGKFPRSHKELQALPGVGPYTAGAIMAFAFNDAVPLIETNIRSVYIHHFFKEEHDVPDTELVRYIVRTLDTENPREWYWALMDYGAYLKKEHGNMNVQSKHYVRQSAFKGSDRQIRGALLRLLIEKSRSRRELLNALSSFEDARVDAQIARLQEEGLITQKRKRYLLP